MNNNISAWRQIRLIVKNEYLTDIRNKSFWIVTIFVPIIMGAFSIFIGFLAQESDSLQALSNPTGSNMDDMSGREIFAMLMSMLLTIFIMVYGAQIFNKVKAEKCNRIVEILATSVDGRSLMFAKIISVALIGLTQILIWGIIFLLAGGILILMLAPEESVTLLLNPTVWEVVGISILYFTGGYLLYSSLYAASGAMTDRNNENQEYMTILTFILLGSFYIGMFAVENTSSMLTRWCDFIPFTSPTVGAINSAAGILPWWQTLISLLILYGTAFLSISISGKIYRSSLLLTGKKFTPKDIVTFLKAK